MNFKNGGGGGGLSGAVEFLESGYCFDARSNIPYVFVVRIQNKLHIVIIACRLLSKYMLGMQKQGGALVLVPPK